MVMTQREGPLPASFGAVYTYPPVASTRWRGHPSRSSLSINPWGIFRQSGDRGVRLCLQERRGKCRRPARERGWTVAMRPDAASGALRAAPARPGAPCRRPRAYARRSFKKSGATSTVPPAGFRSFSARQPGRHGDAKQSGVAAEFFHAVSRAPSPKWTFLQFGTKQEEGRHKKTPPRGRGRPAKAAPFCRCVRPCQRRRAATKTACRP